ncbi:Ref family recombination enhancement nuclease, partial [Proteus mirabilis]
MIKSKTKEERQWLSDVAELGCICCRNMGLGASRAEIHHVRTG